MYRFVLISVVKEQKRSDLQRGVRLFILIIYSMYNVIFKQIRLSTKKLHSLSDVKKFMYALCG
jgi:hypothetical protein